MNNILYSSEYEVLARFLVEQRTSAGLSQREVARRLRRSQTHVHKIESRQRRLELVEFCRLALALGIDPHWAFSELVGRLADELAPAPRPVEAKSS